MKIINVKYNEDILAQSPLSACIGFFDGLHQGHQQLVKRVLEQKDLIPAMITFDPDPLVIIRNNPKMRHIMTLDDKIRIAELLGIEVFIILNSDKDFLTLTPDDFVQKVLKPLNIHHLVCGFDFHYGFRGQGTTETLKQYSNLFKLDVISEVDYQKEKISSSRITRYLKEGRVQEAKKLLTRPYTVSGTIIPGNQKGREIGFPTANLAMNPLYHEVKEGVYITQIEIDNIWYQSITNVGHNLTFNTSEPLSIETYILDFNQSIYGKNVRLAFLFMLRPEIKFETVNELIQQMELDEKITRNYFSSTI